MGMTTEFEESLSNSKPTSFGKRFAKRVLRVTIRLSALFIALSLALVVLFKFIPPLYTPLMTARSLQALFSGDEAHIYYEWTPYDKISSEAAIAVVASEDQNFPNHAGFDWEGIRQAFKYNQKRKRTRGGSTISQQVAKNVFLWNNRSYVRKAVEAYFTVLIEVIWGKERILEVYLNVAEMGNQTFGVQAASRRYFGQSAHQLTRRQAATLAAVLPNPRRFSAQKPSSYIQKRASFISRQVRALGGPTYLKELRRF